MSSRTFLARIEGTPIYSFPDVTSQLVYKLPKDGGYPGNRRVTVAGGTWIELSPNGLGGPGLFVREADVYPAR